MDGKIFSHLARPNLAELFYHMTNLEKNLVDVLTREAVAFVVGPYGFFRPCSRTVTRGYVISSI